MVTDFIVLTKEDGELIAVRVDIIESVNRVEDMTYIKTGDIEYMVTESVEEIIKLIDNCK